MRHRRARFESILVLLLAMGLARTARSLTPVEWDALGDDDWGGHATPFYRGDMPAEGDPWDYPPKIMREGDVAPGTTFVSWYRNGTAGSYIGGAGLYPSSVGDVDRVRVWNEYLNQWGPWNLSGDASNFCYEYASPWFDQIVWSPGTVGYLAYWCDYPGSEQTTASDDGSRSHQVGVSVVNNTYPGFSYILAGSEYLSYRVIDENNPPPPPYSVFDGGKVHIAAGDALWLTARLHVISYDVDVLTGESTIFSLEDAEDNHWYYFGPAGSNDPEYIPQHIFNCSDDPGIYHYTYYHAGIGGMLTPNENPSVSGDVCIVEGTPMIPNVVPRGPTSTPVMIEYTVAPEGVRFDSTATSGPMFFDMYDPSTPEHRYHKYLPGQTGTHSFPWYGDLYTYNEQGNKTGGPFYCYSSKTFGVIYISVEDYCYTDYSVQLVPHTFSFHNSGLSFYLASDDGNVLTEIQAGVPFNVYCQPSGTFHPTRCELRIEKAFQVLSPPPSLPYNESHLIHQPGSYLEITGNPHVSGLLTNGVYETGSRTSRSVPGTDLGPRTITLSGWDEAYRNENATINVIVMRNATLTAYFTPYEANPDYVGPWPDGCYYSPYPVTIGQETIYYPGHQTVDSM